MWRGRVALAAVRPSRSRWLRRVARLRARRQQTPRLPQPYRRVQRSRRAERARLLLSATETSGVSCWPSFDLWGFKTYVPPANPAFSRPDLSPVGASSSLNVMTRSDGAAFLEVWPICRLRSRSAPRGPLVRLSRDGCQSQRRYVERRGVRHAWIDAGAAKTLLSVEGVGDAPRECWSGVRLALVRPALNETVELCSRELDEELLPRLRRASVVCDEQPSRATQRRDSASCCRDACERQGEDVVAPLKADVDVGRRGAAKVSVGRAALRARTIGGEHTSVWDGPNPLSVRWVQICVS